MLEWRLTTWLRPVLMFFAGMAILTLAACGGGSGAPNNPYAPPAPGVQPLTVYPFGVTAYPGIPVTLSISGGIPPYTALSTNPAIMPVARQVTGSTVVLLANNVAEDTGLSIGFQDSSVPPQSQAVGVTVRPALLIPNAITITGSTACTSGGQLCSGTNGTASVKVAGPGGAGLANRQVRFDIVQGNFSIVSTNPGQPNVQTLTVVTDQNGVALVVLAVPPNAVSQLGVIRATEITSGVQVTGQFTISQQITGTTIVSTIPNGRTIINGPFKNVCSTGVRVTHYIFGGTPPYRVSVNFPDAVTLVNSVVNVQGGSFDIVTNGSCFVGLTFTIVDSAGYTVSTPPTVDNIAGQDDPPAPIAPLAVSPPAYGPVNCTGGTFPFTITGKPPFSASASRPGVVFGTNPVPTSPGTLSVSGVPPGGTTTITIGDGNTTQQLTTVTITCL